MTRRCFHDGSHEAAELSSDRGDGDMEMLLLAQVVEQLQEATLSLERDGDDLGCFP